MIRPERKGRRIGPVRKLQDLTPELTRNDRHDRHVTDARADRHKRKSMQGKIKPDPTRCQRICERATNSYEDRACAGVQPVAERCFLKDAIVHYRLSAHGETFFREDFKSGLFQRTTYAAGVRSRAGDDTFSRYVRSRSRVIHKACSCLCTTEY